MLATNSCVPSRLRCAFAGYLLTAVAGTIFLMMTSAQMAQPTLTVSMETTYRPEYADVGSGSYSPIPITPDLGSIANSVAAQPSVASAMSQAKRTLATSNARGEL
ncbi:hypothetical protein BX070DRAFT_221211 [Coemansia spiralis]|nr:hypothetical protein BX070DRAFT_221211 [Coemansia spiralis]